MLGEDDGAWAADLFEVTEAGTFEHGTSVLRLARDLDDDPARWRRVDAAALLAARAARPQPARDDKVVAAWNGLAITALAEFGAAAATRAATWSRRRAVAGSRGLLADVHVVDGRLRRVSRDGVVGAPGGRARGLRLRGRGVLRGAPGHRRGRWLELAGALLDTALERFADGDGGFFDTADDAEALVVRPADPTDNATPSGLSALVAALVSYTALTGEPGWVAPWRSRQPAGPAVAAASCLRPF